MLIDISSSITFLSLFVCARVVGVVAQSPPTISKTVTPIAVQLVEYETPLAFAEVVSRLEAQVNKANSSGVIPRVGAANTQAELTSIVDNAVGSSDFLYFIEFPFQKILQLLEGSPQPGLVAYTIGNPLIAQGIIEHNRLAGYSIPPRLLVAEKQDRNGTVVSYQLPSSVMDLPDGRNDPTLTARVKSLDEKVENLVLNITSTD